MPLHPLMQICREGLYGEAWETELPAFKFDDSQLEELFWLALVLMKVLLPEVL